MRIYIDVLTINQTSLRVFTRHIVLLYIKDDMTVIEMSNNSKIYTYEPINSIMERVYNEM